MSLIDDKQIAIIRQTIYLTEDFTSYRKKNVSEDVLTQIKNEVDGVGSVESLVAKEKRESLYQYLYSKDDETIHFLKTVMYVGRDITEPGNKSQAEIYSFIRNGLVFESKEREIFNIIEKNMKLKDYFLKGIDLLY